VSDAIIVALIAGAVNIISILLSRWATARENKTVNRKLDIVTNGLRDDIIKEIVAKHLKK
jgi:hypothetical protein